jgi:hypothetical protein
VAKDDIPLAYYHQMQMQMECTGIDECEYVEFRFKQMNYTDWCKESGEKGFFTVSESKGVLYDIQSHEEDCQVVYWVLQSVKDVFVPQTPFFPITQVTHKHVYIIYRFVDFNLTVNMIITREKSRDAHKQCKNDKQ